MRRKQLLMEGKLPPPNSPAHLLPLSLLLKGSTIVSSPTFLTMYRGEQEEVCYAEPRNTGRKKNTEDSIDFGGGRFTRTFSRLILDAADRRIL